jgi:arylsulfatase A-like enzyme
LRLLDEHHTRPFFLALGIHKPHDPFVAPRKYFDLHPKDSVKLANQPSDRSPLVRGAIPNPSSFASFSDLERREFKRAYQACVSYADAQLGRVLSALDRLNLWENTMVILIGDHGYHLGEHDWWNKDTVYEVGVRSPMMAWVPGAKGMGKSTDAMIEFLDIYPTLADYAGLKPAHRLSGTSLREVFENPSQPGKPAAYSQVNRGQLVGRSVRTKRWRYTEWGPNGKAGRELYDHHNDPNEYHNLAESSEFADDRAQMVKLLRQGFPIAKYKP